MVITEAVTTHREDTTGVITITITATTIHEHTIRIAL